MKVMESHKKLLDLLQNKEKYGERISKKEILLASGWKQSTFSTYLNKGQLSDFLHEVSDGYFEASNSVGLTPQQFTQLLSQSKHRRGLGHNCKSGSPKHVRTHCSDG
jgi:hypothetical protein